MNCPYIKRFIGFPPPQPSEETGTGPCGLFAGQRKDLPQRGPGFNTRSCQVTFMVKSALETIALRSGFMGQTVGHSQEMSGARWKKALLGENLVSKGRRKDKTFMPPVYSHYEMYVRHYNSGVFVPFDLILKTVRLMENVYSLVLWSIKCVSFLLQSLLDIIFRSNKYLASYIRGARKIPYRPSCNVSVIFIRF
jgi:hypothetical protein